MIIKITFVWVVSTAISCPVLVYGFVDPASVFSDGDCSPRIRNFVIYGSVFAFYVPLFTMLLTYCRTVRILRGSRTAMLRYVDGTNHTDGGTSTNRKCQKTTPASEKRNERTRPIKCRSAPVSNVVYTRGDDTAVLSTSRPVDVISGVSVVAGVGKQRECDFQNPTYANYSREGSFKQDVLSCHAHKRCFLSKSQPHLPSMAPQRRLSDTTASQCLVDTHRMASNLRARNLESADSCDDASFMTSLNSVLSRIGVTTETDGSDTWSDADEPHILEKLSLIENEMDECLTCRPPVGAQSVPPSNTSTDDEPLVNKVPAKSVVCTALLGDRDRSRSRITKSVNTHNCPTSDSCCVLKIGESASVLSRETLPSNCTCGMASVTSQQVRALNHDNEVTGHPSMSTHRPLFNFDTSPDQSSEKTYTGMERSTGVSPNREVCHHSLIQVQQDPSPSSKKSISVDVDSNVSHTEAQFANIPTENTLKPTPIPGRSPHCLYVNINSLATRSEAKERFLTNETMQNRSRDVSQDESHTGPVIPTTHPTKSELAHPRINSLKAPSTDGVNMPSSTDTDCSSTDNQYSRCYAMEQSTTVAPLCGESRLKRFLRREKAPHWKSLTWVHRKRNKTRRAAVTRELVYVSKRMLTKERKASKVLGIIVGVFLVLWTPFFVMNILSVACPLCMAAMTDSMSSSIVWLGYLSSLANPVIYTMFNTAFRQAFYRILTCQYRRQSAYYYNNNKMGESMYLSNSTRLQSEHRVLSRQDMCKN